MAAPSANNWQPWHFVVVRDDHLRTLLSQTHRWSGMIAEAPIAIAVCGERSSSDHWVADASAATENLLLAATAMGLGAVWIGIHPSERRESHVRDVLGIPDEVGVLCLIALGRPAESKPPRDSFRQTRVHSERW
jgi:nitroreductase